MALNARDGELLWKAVVGGPVSAGPIAYTVGGKAVCRDLGGKFLIRLWTEVTLPSRYFKVMFRSAKIVPVAS